jgi:hypothetical protein
MLSVKKRKHRKKTRRKIKKGGNGVRVYHIPSDNNNTLLYPIIEVIPLNNAYSKKKYVKDGKDGKDGIIPYFSGAVSLRDFVPILDNGEEKDVFDMLLGKYVPNNKVKQSTIYVHSKRDLQMIELYENIKSKYSEIANLKLVLVMLLETDRRVSKKLNNMINAMKTYIDAAAAAAADAANAAAAADAADADAAFKTQFGLPNDIVLEKLSMYESKILDKLYKEIDDDSVKDIMEFINDPANAPPSHKYKLIYSENNDNTYDNIRYVILTLMLNTKILDYVVAAHAAAAAPAAVQGNNNQIPAIIAAIAAANAPAPAPAPAPAQGNNNQIPAIIAAIAAANAPAPAPAPAPEDPLQARALIAAIVAALARP